MKKAFIIIGAVILVAGLCVGAYLFFYSNPLAGQIAIPYIAHQKPRIDPHVPAPDGISDKLDEVVFDGLFNVQATPSGITYEDGLGELMGIDEKSVVRVRLKPQKKWHASYAIAMDKKKVAVSDREAVLFTAKDLKFTLRRIERLGSLSPDFILVAQAIEGLDFTGPDENDEIQLQFKGDRQWVDTDIKEVLSFKILPANSVVDAPEYKDGTGPYMLAGQYEDVIYFTRDPSSAAQIATIVLKPFIDNSTYTTELKNRAINTLLATPFGSISPILRDSTRFFVKSNISTCFFALFYNTQRLSLEQRMELRRLIYNKALMERFFKVGTPQQRHVVDYKGNRDNYNDYLNFSVFPSTSYYVEDSVVIPLEVVGEATPGALPDTVRIQTCLNYGYREELASLVEILNDPSVFNGDIKATAVQNEEIAQGNYDAVLVPISGYRSNFLFDLYDIFLREPDFATHKVNLAAHVDETGKQVVDEASFTAAKNFFRLDLSGDVAERDQKKQLLEYVFGFMSSREIGDKQEYAKRIDELEQQLALGSWLFSLPSLTYFSTQFEEKTIDLYGVASQLSTIEKWREKGKK